MQIDISCNQHCNVRIGIRELEINILTRLLTDTSLMQSHVSTEQYSIEVAALELHPIISLPIVTFVYKPSSFLI